MKLFLKNEKEILNIMISPLSGLNKKQIILLNIYIFVKTNVFFTFKKQLLRNNE